MNKSTMKKPTMKAVDKRSYGPNLEVNARELPEIKGMKVGQKVTLVIQAEVAGMNNATDYRNMPMPDISQAAAGARPEPPKVLQGSFKVLKVGYDPDNDGDSSMNDTDKDQD